VPVCPTCGKKFSGFSIGPNPATECSDCRKAKKQADTAKTAVSQVVGQSPAPLSRLATPLPVVTFTIIVANVLAYLAMGLSGASWAEPGIRDALKWGADFGPLTLSGQWWRLFTSTFVHFGIIHIAFNMWCLWNLGRTLEPLMGRKAFGVMYVASGLAASLVSVAWNPWRVSAGASGAIFGVAGALVSYLALKKTSLHQTLVRQNLKSLAIFIAYNLVRGLGGNVDNSAHLGGLIAGLILGTAMPRLASTLPGAGEMDQPAPVVPGVPLGGDPPATSRENRIAATIAFCSAAVLLLAGVAVHAKNITAARYGKAVEFVTSGHLDGAVTEMQQVVKLDPNLFSGQALLGGLLLDQQNPSAAVPVFEKAQALDPHDDEEIHHNLALAYLGVSRPADALSEIGMAFDAEKNNPWAALFIRGMAEGETGDFASATADLRAAAEANPNLSEAKDALARFEAMQRKPSESRAPYVKADQLPELAIPYSKLMMKSEDWPLYP
jgi:membrane associated rhomboid family serine protease/Flp pilus assembly protein TadD